MRGAGPWYEVESPSPEYVRDDQYRKMIRIGSVWRGVVVDPYSPKFILNFDLPKKNI